MKAVALQNISIEGCGLLGKILLEKGWSLDVTDLSIGEPAPKNLDGADMLIVLGGPMNVYETDKYSFLRSELELIEEGYRKDIPVIGFCLGAQLMAVAMGAEVRRNRDKELGWYNLSLTDAGQKHPIFTDMPETFPTFQWHGDSFDIPVGAENLASTEICNNQCFAYGKSVAMQFHPEVQKDHIYKWLNAYRQELIEEMGQGAETRIKQETENLYTHFGIIADKLLRKIVGK